MFGDLHLICTGARRSHDDTKQKPFSQSDLQQLQHVIRRSDTTYD